MSQPRDLRRLSQLDLFRPRPTTPDWEQLPADDRCKALPLLARLLRVHRQAGVAVDRGREVDNE